MDAYQNGVVALHNDRRGEQNAPHDSFAISLQALTQRQFVLFGDSLSSITGNLLCDMMFIEMFLFSRDSSVTLGVVFRFHVDRQ